MERAARSSYLVMHPWKVGLWLYLFFRGPKNRTPNRILLLPLDSGAKPSIRWLSVDPNLKFVFNSLGPQANVGFHYTPDGRALAFVVERKGMDNIWTQPIDGSKGRQITGFKSDLIRDFRWSPDGKHLAVLHFHSSADVILLHDTSTLRQ